MNVPSFPTDSLYKFQALAGIALILGCLWLTGAQLPRLSQDAERLTVTTAEAMAQAEYTEALVDIAGNMKHPTAKDVQEIDRQRYEAKKVAAKAAALSDSLKREVKLVDRLLQATIIPSLFGLWYTFAGFKRWQKVQNLEDELLRLQVESAKATPEGTT